MLDLLQVFSVLEKEGLPLAKTLSVESEEDLKKISFPYFMKVNIPGHKLSQGGVVKIPDIAEAKENFCELKKRFSGNKILIQESVAGEEMAIGLKEDRVFGKILMIGSGGSDIEKKKDIEFRAVPLNIKEIREAVMDLKNYRLIEKKDIDGFVNLALKVSRLDFKELDLNPVFVSEDRVVIADGRGRI